jgi:hypothetical protein
MRPLSSRVPTRPRWADVVKGLHERGRQLRRPLHINTIVSPIPIRVYNPATVTPRQTSAMTLSDWNLICLLSTAHSDAIVAAQ